MSEELVPQEELIPQYDDQGLIALLDEKGISYSLHHHPPVFTVEEAQKWCEPLPGTHIKNLFLRDRKRNYYLLTLRDKTQVDLKAIRSLIGASGNLSFASPDALWACLGVRPGSVTPLALVNDPEKNVSFYLESGLEAADRLNAHPLRNDQTVGLSGPDLMRLLKGLGVSVHLL